MSDCLTYPNANALNYCGTTLYVGTLDESVTITPVVVFTDLATMRKEQVDVDAYPLPDVRVTMPTSLVPGHFYSIQIVGPNDIQGLHPIEFTPYTYNPETDSHTASGDPVEGVKLQFMKVWVSDAVHSHDDQWITL